MYTCRTCKLLKHSQAERANSIIDALFEWRCPYRWWDIRPSRGEGCINWENMNGKHWV